MSVETKYAWKGSDTVMKKTIDVKLGKNRSAAITLDSRQINCYNEFFGREESEADRAAREINERRQAVRLGAIGAAIGLSGVLLMIAMLLVNLL